MIWFLVAFEHHAFIDIAVSWDRAKSTDSTSMNEKLEVQVINSIPILGVFFFYLNISYAKHNHDVQNRFAVLKLAKQKWVKIARHCVTRFFCPVCFYFVAKSVC